MEITVEPSLSRTESLSSRSHTIRKSDNIKHLAIMEEGMSVFKILTDKPTENRL